MLRLPQSRRAMPRTWLWAALQKRGNVGTQKEKMERHISLVETERTEILWKAEKVGKKYLNRLFIARKNSVTVDLSFFSEKL